jgi:SpoVK/Ycf46/Vps4 family AAA+-type ATPase
MDTSTNQTADTTPDQTEAASGQAKRRRSATSSLTLLPKLLENFLWNQRGPALEVAKEIASHLEDSHPAVHRKLASLLGRQLQPVSLPQRPEDLVTMSDARHGFDAVTLPEDVLAKCHGIVAEHHRSDELAAFKLSPRHKVLLSGPPGNGKTMLAEALAFELGVPFLSVSHGGLVDSHLGGTGKNIDKLFVYARTAPCVLFIDEFDGISIKRAGASDVGEIRRVTNHLLIAIEKLPAYVTLVCATNAENLLDDAIKRRFDLTIEIPAPTRALKLLCAQRELAPALTPGKDVSNLADRVADLSLENLFYVTERCRQIRRDLVLNSGQGVEALLAGV